MVRTWKAAVVVQISVWEYGFECAVIHAARLFDPTQLSENQSLVESAVTGIPVQPSY